ncbi:MAG: fibronectin type III domain-containing protein [Acutalibacteraceae bacterium]
MNIPKKIVSVFMCVIIFATVFVEAPFVSAATYKFNASSMVKDNGYNYYKAWSQDQYPWHNTKPYDATESDWMNRYGCSTIAMCKMFVEAGKMSPLTYNPYKLMQNYAVTKKSVNYITDIGIWWYNLASAFGMEYYGTVSVNSASVYSKAMKYYNMTDSDYYLVLQVNGGQHYVHIDRTGTINEKEIVINNSTNNGSSGGTLLNSAGDYYNRVSDLKLSNTKFTASKLYVFRTVSAPKLSSTTSIDYKSIRIKWYPVGVAEGYRVYKREKGTNKYNVVATIRKQSDKTMAYTDKDCKTGVTYEYTVKGFRHVDGKTIWTNCMRPGIEGTAVASAVNFKSAKSAGYDSIDISWTPVSGATGYRLYRKAKGESSWSKIAPYLNGENMSSYTDSSVVTGTPYTYKIRAYTKVDSTYIWGQTSSSTVTATAIPDTPEVVSASRNSFNSIFITWTGVSGATGYKVFRKGPGQKKYHPLITIKDKTVRTLLDTSLETGSTYTYTVKAYRTSGKVTTYSNYDSKGKSAKVTLDMPWNIVTQSLNYKTIKITWMQSEGANGYYIYRRIAGESKWNKIGEAPITSTSTASYKDSSCSTATIYEYNVKAYRNVKAGTVTSTMQKSGSTGQAVPAPPKISKVTSHKTGMGIYWNKVSGSTGYRIYRRSQNGSWEKVLLNTTNTEYVDKTCVKGEKYYYRLKTYRTVNGTKIWSDYSEKSALTECKY